MRSILSSKIMLLSLVFSFLLSCGGGDDSGELTVTITPNATAVVPVAGGHSCQDIRDYMFQLSQGTKDVSLASSLSGNIFWFNSLHIQYSGYEDYEIISKLIYIDFNDSRLNGKFRCDLNQEADAFFDAATFSSSGAINGTNGEFKSTSNCKIICTKAVTVSSDMKGKEFTVTGQFKVRFIVQKKNSDDMPVNIYAQQAVTVAVFVDE